MHPPEVLLINPKDRSWRRMSTTTPSGIVTFDSWNIVSSPHKRTFPPKVFLHMRQEKLIDVREEPGSVEGNVYFERGENKEIRLTGRASKTWGYLLVWTGKWTWIIWVLFFFLASCNHSFSPKRRLSKHFK